MRSYQTKAGIQFFISIVTALFLNSPLTTAAPLARQPDLRSQPQPTPSPKSKVQELKNEHSEPTISELLSEETLIQSSKENFPEKLPEMLPEEPDAAPIKSTKNTPPPSIKALKDSPTSNLLGPEASSNASQQEESALTPSINAPAPVETAPQAGSPKDTVKETMTPEVDTEIGGAPSSSDIAEFPGDEENLDEPTDEEKMVSEPETLEAPTVANQASESDDAEQVTEQKWQRGVPRYDQVRPNWGFQFAYSPSAFGSDFVAYDEITATTDSYSVSHIGLGFDWEPSFLQAIGVIALGGTLNLYPFSPLNGITSGALDVWSAGFSVKYQAKYLRGQWIVPYVGYESQFLRYQTDASEIGSGSTMLSGPVFGALLLLNWMEPKAAFEMFENTGVVRSYLFTEFKTLTADSEPVFDTDGSSIHFGLRLEL